MRYLFKIFIPFLAFTIPNYSFADMGTSLRVQIINPINIHNERIQGYILPTEIERLQKSNVNMGGNDTKGVELTNPNEINISNMSSQKQKKMISNCADYSQLKSKGWYAETTYDLSMESFFKETCTTLDLLSKARPSKKSYFNSTVFQKEDIDKLSSEMLNSTIALGDSLPCEKIPSLKKCTQKLQGKIFLDDQKLSYEDAYNIISFSPKVRGDINYDGLEDIALSYGHHLKQGSYRGYGFICLERKSKDALITTIACESPK